MNDIIDLARPEIRALKAYSSARSEVKGGSIWLNANENPYDTGDLVRHNRYPMQQPEDLINRLSSIYQTKPEQLLITRGSDEAVDILIRAFCRANQDAILICPPTYGMYEISAQIQGAEVVAVPLVKEAGFSLDIEAIIKLWQPEIKLIFICSPNNPTGNLIAREQILQLCCTMKNKALIIVDEAYIEFSSGVSLSDDVLTYNNLVVLRTLSKAYGLAGVRCGSIIAKSSIINLVRKILAPYPIASPVIATVMSELTIKLRQISDQINILISERESLMIFLSSLQTVNYVWPSETNFLLVAVHDVTTWLETCMQYGVVIRDRSNMFGIEGCVRISIGTPEENKKLKMVLRKI